MPPRSSLPRAKTLKVVAVIRRRPGMRGRVARHAVERWPGMRRNGGPAWRGIRNQLAARRGHGHSVAAGMYRENQRSPRQGVGNQLLRGCPRVVSDQAIFDPLPAVLVGLSAVVIDAAQPRATHAAGQAVVVARRRRIDQLAARRGHCHSVTAAAARCRKSATSWMSSCGFRVPLCFSAYVRSSLTGGVHTCPRVAPLPN